MEDTLIQIVNGKVITPQGVDRQARLVLKAGRIAEITREQGGVEGAQTIDAQGAYVAPGCIDTHLHGGDGHDFTEATPEAFRAIAYAHATQGVTTLYPTLAVAPTTVFRQAIKACETVVSQPYEGARIEGLHLEGNYINPLLKGGQDERFIQLPDPAEYQELLESTRLIKRWTAAPELPGALEFARYAHSKGILVSLGHTAADYPTVKRAYEAGFTHATHFYNAMSGVHKQREYKHEGTIESVYLVPEMTVELVADGIHVPPAILRLVCAFKGIDRISLISDAMAAAACLRPEHLHLDPRMIVEDGVCKLADRSALTGSIASGIRLIQVMAEKAEIPVADCVRMAATNPARLMSINDRKGSIERGKDADLILFDENFHLQSVWIGGKQLGMEKRRFN
ncbi:MAG TPA: N-acetylglucosamine-6-phosphate deacetylase [Candidatus Parabacteroides intestinipullorum]|uniref:N-acetylglucosamine-6-phosphate deacetylase n=1 Tax=Candidatus Parabacteroides intestinipullorum TaxID=2838723 RepID=A0A9D1X6M8_9BACT|nr:N-acetylglucosamine-6-phosphate deacetylase [Candidatus Parabacteroides intestinipullorum]